MFRRARFSVKPNVRPNTTGRGGGGGGGSSSIPAAASLSAVAPKDSAPTPGSSAEDPALLQPGDADRDRVGDIQPGSGRSRSEKTSDASSQRGCNKHAETLLQRRKRISTVPNLAKPRVAPSPVQRPPNLASKCPPRQVSHSSTFGTSPLQKELPSFEKANVENSPKSPVLPEKKTPVPQVPQFTPFKKSINKEPNAYMTTQRSEEAFEKNLSTPLKERPTQEKTLQEEVSSQTQSKSPLVKESKICSDREKIIKTKKLRKMLKEELKKEKEQRKHKSPIIEKTMPEDRSKMIMRDFIYYLPENNPMKSSLVEEKTAEKTSTVTQSKEPEERLVADHVDENEEDDDEEEEEDGPLLVPRVKVAEDGTIILDEESLTVEVLRTKGQCVVEENDPIFERGSTTTYSSFRRNCYTKPWSEKETEMFFLAISMVGTDFSMISQLFPHRARTEIKNKFKREEKTNGWRIDKAFKEKKPFDFTFFAKLLEKVLENERRRKEKDAKCQRQKERNANEKKISKSQKKQQVSVVNGQHSHGQDDLQHAHVSDTEMEVDVETAEKENEEALSLLEQAEGLAVPESVVTKKKRKRKKKDSDHEMENIPDETVLPFKTAEEERSRKKRKNISPIEIDGINKGGEGLEVPNGVPPDEVLSSVEDDLHCYTLDEETEGGDASSIHGPGEVDALEAVSEHHTEQPSESPDPTTEICAAKNLVPELDKWDDNRNMASPHHENEIRKTKRAVTKKAMEEEQQQIITSDSIRTSEKREPLVDDILEVKTSSQSVDGKQKSVAENKAVNITGAVIDEACRTNKEVDDEAQETEKSPEEKTEFRSRWQRPTPNILMASCRKEARIQSKVNKPDPDEIERKNTVSEEIHSTNTERIPEKESCGSDTEHLAVKKSTLQESSKRSTLKPAPLARGRIQRPQPNLGRLFRRQGGLAKNTEKEEGKRTETGVGTETCGCSEPLNKNITEAATNEVDTTPSAELENKTVASGEQVGSVHMIQHPETKPLECEGHKLQTTSLSSSSLEDVTDLVTRDISLQQEQKEFLTETEDSLKNYSPSQNQSLEKLADEASLLQIKEEKLNKKDETETTEHSLININRECIKSSNLDEEANFRIMPGTDNQEAVTTSEPLLSTPSSLDFKSGEQNEVLLHSDNQEKNSVGAENSQGVSKQSTIRPALLPRSRFQKPKPNIGRAVGRKEVQSLEGNETIETVTAVEKLELKKSERIEIPISFTKPSQSLPAEALEKKSVDNEKIILEDSQVLITSHNISDQCLSRENPVLQERKPSVIKPAQLVRGRFQRARPSLGRIHDKKQGTVSENTNAPVENEVGKYSMEIFKTSDLDPPSKDEVSVQASLDNVGRKEDSESSEGTLSKRCIVQKLPSPENLQESLVLIPEGKAHLSKDEGKHLDIPESDISAPQEISQLKNTKPAQPRRRHLQKPKPDVTQASENKDAISSEDVSLEDVAERDTENDTTPCGSISGEISTLIHISQTLVEAASVAKSPKEKTCADGVETVSLKRSEHSERFDSSEQPSRSENQTKKEVSKPVSVQERHFKGKQPVRTLKQKKNCGDSRTFSPSEWEDDGSKKRKHHPKNKAHVSRGKSLKTSLRKKPRKECGSAKVSLVTLRASSQEEEDDDDGDDFEPDYELECFSPEEVNKAPVFVPRGLRSPNPVPIQIEETMEELEIYENVADELCLPYEVPPDAQTMIQEEQLCSSQVFIEEEQKENTGIIYGSTEAAMTLLAMRDPVFQLNIVTQENQLEHAIKDELSATDSLHTEPSEPEKAFPCNELCSTASKIELVSSMSVNRSTTEDYSTESPRTDNCFQEEVNVPLPTSSKNELVPSHHTKGLGECSQETSIASSDSPVSKGNKTTILARCRFPKPKPNLNRCLGLRRKVPPKSLGLLSEEEQLNNIKNDNKVSGNSTEERKVQLEQNLKSIEVVQSSSEEKHDFQPGNGENAMQKTNTERKDLAKETWEVAWESTTPEAAAHFQGLLSSCNTNMDGQISTLAGHEISTVDEAQIEALKQSSISVTREITAVSCSMKEYPTTEEEPTFILTLVEIPADSEDCGGGPILLQQTPGELLPATVLFTPANTDAVELTGEDSTRFIPTAEEGNATCINSSTESKELHTLASETLTDSGSASWNNLKNSPEALEGSCDPNGKERLASSNEEDLKSSNKEISPKLQRIPEEPDEENSEKLNVSKKKSVSTSESVAELNVKEKEQPLSFPNLAVQLEEADRSDEQMSRMLYVGKTEKVEEQRNIVDTCKSVQPKQGGHKRALPKAQLSRSNQRTPGFLPLICKDNADEEMTTKLHKELLQETEIIASKSTTKSPVSSRHNKEEAQEDISLLSAIPGSSTSGKGSFYNTQVSSGLSDCEGSSKEQEKEEEPTRISEYFFSDIFMEVDDSE